MGTFKRNKKIEEGKHIVTIMDVKDRISESGKKSIIFVMRRKFDGAKSLFYVSPESYLIDKLLNIAFMDDYREEYKYEEVLGEDLIIKVVKSEDGYFNIRDIGAVSQGISEKIDVFEEDEEEDDDIFDLDFMDDYEE